MRSMTTGGSSWHPGATAALRSSTSTRPTTSWCASSRLTFPPDRPRWRPVGASWCGATSSSGPGWWCAARSSWTIRATAGSASRTATCSRGEMTREPATVAAALRRSRRPAEAVLDHAGDTGDVIVGLGNGEPATVVDALEAGQERLRDVRVHQMFPLRERRYMLGEVAGLRHVSWFLSPVVRDAFHRGGCDLVPNNFSDVPRLMRASTGCSLVLAAVSPPDRHGYFSLGCHAEYVAPMVGAVPFFVEVNQQMPRTFGENQVHVSQVLGWCEADYPLVEVPHPPPRDTDQRIAQHVAERVPDGGHRPGRGRQRAQRGAQAAERPPRPGDPHRAAGGRVRGSGRAGGGDRDPQDRPRQQDRDHLGDGQRPPVPVRGREPRRRGSGRSTTPTTRA